MQKFKEKFMKKKVKKITGTLKNPSIFWKTRAVLNTDYSQKRELYFEKEWFPFILGKNKRNKILGKI